MRFSLLIPHYGRYQLLKECLESVGKTAAFAWRRQHDFRLEIIIVDNNGQRKKWPRTEFFSSSPWLERLLLLRNSKNQGFAAAINQASRRAQGEYFWILNNDVRLANGWLLAMIKAIQKGKRKVASYGGPILNANGRRLESLGLRLYLAGRAENIGNGLSWPQARQEYSAWWQRGHFPVGFNGANVIYRADIFRRLRGFDESFFAYLEDVDLALRLAAAGWRAFFVSGAISYHQGGAAIRKMDNFRQRLICRNWYWLIIKNYPLAAYRRAGWHLFWERLANLNYLLRSLRFDNFWPTFRWCWQNLVLKLPRQWRRRQPISYEKLLAITSAWS